MNTFFLFVLTLTFALQICPVYPLCAFSGSPKGQPPKRNSHPTPPVVYEGVIEACPYYTGKPVCCNKLQQITMQTNFQDIDLLFGTDCPICAVNMKKLWCEFTCSPNQADFVRAGEIVKTRVGHREYDALEVELHMSLNTTCHLYSSCNKIPEVGMMSSSAMGFLQFQGDHAVEQGNTLISLNFHEEVKDGYKPMTYEAHSCDKKVNGTLDGYPNVTTCPCKFCDLSCNGTNENLFVPPGFFEGFNPTFVLVVYFMLFMFIALVIMIKNYINKKKKQEVSQPEIEEQTANESLIA